MDVVKVTSVLKLFFAFNKSKSEDSLELEESTYNDKFFRWKKDSFQHGQKLTVIYNENRIVIFDTLKVKERLLANRSKIQSSKDKENFGCQFNIINDLVAIIHGEEITEEEVIEFKENERITKEEKDARVQIQNSKK